MPLAVFEEVDAKRQGRGRDDAERALRARQVMRHWTGRFGAEGANGSKGFWELQDRDIDALYKAKATEAGARKRSMDLRMLLLCHALRVRLAPLRPAPPRYHGTRRVQLVRGEGRGVSN